MHQDNVLSGAYIYKRDSSTDWKDVYVGQIYTSYDSINGFEYHETSNITDGSLNARDYSERLEKEEQTGKYVITTRYVTYQDNYNDGRYSNGDIPVTIDERSNYTEGFYPTYTFKGYNSEIYGGGRLTYKSSWNVTKYNKEYECWQERVYYRNRLNTDGITRQTEKVTKYQFFPAQSSGITSMPSQTEAGNAVYNLQGLKVGDTLKNQPAGIYIVKQGGKSFKVVKEK